MTKDFTGDEVYTLQVIDIATNQAVGDLITGVSEQIEWASDSETLYYVTQDQVHRPYKVQRHWSTLLIGSFTSGCSNLILVLNTGKSRGIK